MKKVTAYIHTHWDREWYREFEEFRLRLLEVVDDIVNKLKSGELPVFYFDGQTSALEDYLEINSHKKDEIISLIKDKKLFIGPFYCSADEFLVSTESLLRNLMFGIKKSKDFGCKNFIAYLSDTFGHSRYMPELLKCAGIDKAILWRGSNSKKADLNWYGIKTLYLAQGYFQDFLHSEGNIEKKADAIKKYLNKISEKSGDNLLLPIGGDHLGIPNDLADKIKTLNKIYKDEYKIDIGTPFDYFSKIKKFEKIYGEFLNNDENFILQGVYSSRTDIKRKNHEARNILTKAETFNAFNSFFFGKKSYQNSLDYAYKTLIKNHAHDSIYGCSTDGTNKEILTRYDKVIQIGSGILKRCMRDIESENTISVINLSDEDFEGFVKIKTDKKLPRYLNAVKIGTIKGFPDKILYNTSRVPITEDYTNISEYMVYVGKIQKFSSKKLSDKDLTFPKDIKTSKNSIENKFIRLYIKENKINITDKTKNIEIKDFAGIKDVADIGDSYNFGALKNDKPIFGKIKSYKIYDKKFFACADIKFEINIPKTSTEKGRSKGKYTHILNMKITLDTNSKVIKFALLNNNRSKDHKLSAFVNLPEAVNETLSDDLAGLIKRKFDADFDLNSKIPAPRGKEIKTNTMPVQNFVYSQGVGIITKGVNEIEIDKKRLCITLIRSTGVISNPYNPTRGTPAGPPIETPNLQMQGKNHFEFSVTFTEKAENLYKIATNLNNPPVVCFSDLKEQKFIDKNNENIKIIALKNCDDGIILHTVNISDKAQSVEIKFKNCKIYASNIFEETLEKAEEIKYLPNQIKILKIKK